MVLLAAHALLAPFTADLIRNLPDTLHKRAAARQTDRYLNALRQTRQSHRQELVTCIVSLREVLAERNIKLRVILRPEFDCLLNAERNAPRGELAAQAAAMLATESALKKQGVITVNLLPALHRQVCLQKGTGVITQDGFHYTPSMVAAMARTLEQSMTDHQRSREGRHLMLAGDCYAYSIAAELRSEGVLSHARCFFRNGADNLMAHQLAKAPADALENVREVYWVLSSSHMTEDAKTPLPPPQPMTLGGPVSQNSERTVKATLSKLTTIPQNLGKGSPYPNALILHKFVTSEGEPLLGVIDLMKSQTVDEGIRLWQRNATFILTLRPWEKAVAAEPRLDREQVFDDLGDFSSDRYYITDWTHAPEGRP
jgi:hypothetical protein